MWSHQFLAKRKDLSLACWQCSSKYSPGYCWPFCSTKVHSWLTVFLLSSRFFYTNPLPRQFASSVYWYLRLFLHRCRILHFPLLNFMWFPLSQFSLMFWPIVQVDNEDTGQSWLQYWTLGYTTSVLSPTGLCATDHNPLGPIVQLVFNPPHHPFILAVLCQLAYEANEMKLQEIVSKALLKLRSTTSTVHLSSTKLITSL